MSAPPEVESFIAQVTRAFGDPLPDWLLAGEDGHLDADVVQTRVAEHLRRRRSP